MLSRLVSVGSTTWKPAQLVGKDQEGLLLLAQTLMLWQMILRGPRHRVLQAVDVDWAPQELSISVPLTSLFVSEKCQFDSFAWLFSKSDLFLWDPQTFWLVKVTIKTFNLVSQSSWERKDGAEPKSLIPSRSSKALMHISHRVVMAPPGAGKTSLLQLVSGETTTGTVSGESRERCTSTLIAGLLLVNGEQAYPDIHHSSHTLHDTTP
eukprot:CAMPEP_0175917076 /NCGR_PEP_ID=MMETSP0108-20121206/11177_1 /TAXON_ID=195067 ORGANISM="Goniomonas pacifica, Strain CCMP1869" /NCGR_SAMPLE_ID=MMETSP0108 /ASSEMBLY_ACC=CAM_ASM_000204 /LENGTH=207 /DNA_ID=CAMNT_0017239651 /DNA_START=12 /DNA_END=633 /DNA_ORIENTATION=+